MSPWRAAAVRDPLARTTLALLLVMAAVGAVRQGIAAVRAWRTPGLEARVAWSHERKMARTLGARAPLWRLLRRRLPEDAWVFCRSPRDLAELRLVTALRHELYPRHVVDPVPPLASVAGLPAEVLRSAYLLDLDGGESDAGDPRGPGAPWVEVERAAGGGGTLYRLGVPAGDARGASSEDGR